MASMRIMRLAMLPGLERHADLGLLAIRIATGSFLVYQSHDNVISAARMEEFVRFLRGFGFFMPEVMAPLSVFCQFTAGIGFILGLFTRWLGLVTMVNFIVACWMVHWTQDFAGWWPALILVFLGLHFALSGSGRYGLDRLILDRKVTRLR
jgi:putative oxidoreductase